MHSTAEHWVIFFYPDRLGDFSLSRDTGKPAERHKNLTILGYGLAMQSEPQQCKIPIRICASSTDLQQSSSTGQCRLTALGPMLISLASSNEIIPLVCTIVERMGDFFCPERFNDFFFIPRGWVIFFCPERLGDFIFCKRLGDFLCP